MKHIVRLLTALGFIFQYCIPLYLFSSVFPYTHGAKNAGLTRAGFFALAVLLLIIMSKAKDRIRGIENKPLREALLSVFPIVLWIVGLVAVKTIQNIAVSVTGVYIRTIVFIVIGRALYVVSASLGEEKPNE